VCDGRRRHDRGPANDVGRIDQLGILGLAQKQLTPGGVIGVALLAAGVFLIVRD
jgi:hypothetical protein